MRYLNGKILYGKDKKYHTVRAEIRLELTQEQLELLLKTIRENGNYTHHISEQLMLKAFVRDIGLDAVQKILNNN